MKRSSVRLAPLLLLALALPAACAARGAPMSRIAGTVASTAPSAPARTSASVSDPVVLTYVDVDPSWVEMMIAPASAVVKAWATDPANAGHVLPMSRHILFKVGKNAPREWEAARKKALLVLARLKRGEDFAKLAGELSDDPGSRAKGGAYPGAMVASFVSEYREAYAALAPGETTKAPFKTTFGWHILRKEPIDDEAILSGYRRANALAASRLLAGEIAERLRPARAEAVATGETNAAIAHVLGPAAAAHPMRPEVHLVFVDKVTSDPPGPTCATLLRTAAGKTTIITREKDSGYMVSKAGTEKDIDPTARAAVAAEAAAPWNDCRPERAPKAGLSPEQIRDLIEQARKVQAERASPATP